MIGFSKNWRTHPNGWSVSSEFLIELTWIVTEKLQKTLAKVASDGERGASPEKLGKIRGNASYYRECKESQFSPEWKSEEIKKVSGRFELPISLPLFFRTGEDRT